MHSRIVQNQDLCFAGAGCGVGLGLGWGFGTAFGSQYRSSTVTFQGMELAKKEESDDNQS